MGRGIRSNHRPPSKTWNRAPFHHEYLQQQVPNVKSLKGFMIYKESVWVTKNKQTFLTFPIPCHHRYDGHQVLAVHIFLVSSPHTGNVPAAVSD